METYHKATKIVLKKNECSVCGKRLIFKDWNENGARIYECAHNGFVYHETKVIGRITRTEQEILNRFIPETLKRSRLQGLLLDAEITRQKDRVI